MPGRLIPVPIRGLWQAASEEEREKAHKTGVAILEVWLGQSSRKEVSERLGIPPLRIWQLSQQALAGLTAGLLKQPRSTKGATEILLEDLPARVRKQLKKQEAELESLRRLVGLLREMPAQRQAGTKREDAGAGQKKRAGKPCSSTAAKKSRTSAPRSPDHTGGTSDAGPSTGCDGADASQLDQGVTGGTEAGGPATDGGQRTMAGSSIGGP